MITKEFLLSVGFTEIPHYTVPESFVYDLGRCRQLSVDSVGTPNEIMFICEVAEEDVTCITDLVCIHNYDYDGYLTEERVRVLLSVLVGHKE